MHGHNWKVEVFVVAKELDERGLSIDFRELQALLTEALETIDHSVLNELPQFAEMSPTSENIAKYIFDSLVRYLPARYKLRMVRVSESESTSAAYTP
jgi:6-pyruvoyltetrahydropterin/6-carboxytetrahydropterin synthase